MAAQGRLVDFKRVMSGAAMQDSGSSGPSNPRKAAAPKRADDSPPGSLFLDDEQLLFNGSPIILADGSKRTDGVVGGQLDDATATATGVLGPRPVRLAHPHNDDPWGSAVQDQLGVDGDARAFARLAISRAFIPPLAVGVFGPWGSGKSFFMRLVHEHVDRLKTGTPSKEAPEASTDLFHSAVVQIRFNAWHYAESNLWACLVDHIFTELGAATRGSADTTNPLDEMGTAQRLTLEAAKELVLSRQSQAKRKADLESARGELRRAEADIAKSGDVYWAAFASAFNDPTDAAAVAAKKKFNDAAKELGLPELEHSLEQASQTLNALRSDVQSAGTVLRALVERMGSAKAMVLLLVVVFVVPPLASAGLSKLAGWFPNQVALNEAVATATVVSSTVVAALAWLGHGVTRALRTLESAKKAVNGVVESKLASFKQDLASKKGALDAATIKVNEASALLAASTRRYVEASSEFSGSSAGDRLVRFVRARATDGHYAQHMGLVASIRRDFEALSAQMEGLDEGAANDARRREEFKGEVQALVGDANGHLTESEREALAQLAAPPKLTSRPFKRIVLYVDDLDRCSADKVVEVLQAVHMLLAFRLFVVFVAVDVRWVAQALREKYPELVTRQADAGHPGATPSDYLEKIFQVPYWVPEVGVEQGVHYLRALAEPSASSPSPDSTPGDVSLPTIRAEELRLTDDDVSLLAEFVEFVGGAPRKVLRLVNVFRLIKASGAFEDENSEVAAALPRAMAFQLAMAISSPDVFPRWLRLLERDTGWGLLEIEQHLEYAETHDVPSTDPGAEALEPQFLRALQRYATHSTYDDEAQLLLARCGRLAARYSFASQSKLRHTAK